MSSAACPPDLALERIALGEPHAAAPHAAGCARCQAKLESFRAGTESYRASAPALAVKARLAEAGSRRAGEPRSPRAKSRGRRLAAAGGLAFALAASLAAVLLWRPPPPTPPDPFAVKGPRLGAWVQRAGTQGATPWNGAPLRPGDRLQATLELSAQSYAAVWLKDPAGELARLFPEDAAALAALPPGPARGVGPSVGIPERTGALELIAVFRDAPFDVASADAALRDGASSTLQPTVLRIPFESGP